MNVIKFKTLHIDKDRYGYLLNVFGGDDVKLLYILTNICRNIGLPTHYHKHLMFVKWSVSMLEFDNSNDNLL